MTRLLARSVALALALLAGSCTMKQQEAPEVSGPSEFGTSITVAVSPDVLQQDGASQSVVTVTARGPSGEPVSNLPVRAEIRVGGTVADFGTLSARSAVTGGDGRALLVYTAPPGLPFAVDEFTIVEIGITPVGSDFGNSSTRIASLRLVPAGVVLPPAGLQPRFTFAPSTPTDHEPVLFDASGSQSPANNPIVAYDWNFGDGGRGSGRSIDHEFDAPGTYVVTLTIRDGAGRTASASQTVTVGAGADPTAVFAVSPTEPEPGRQVFFNGAGSRGAPGRQIVSWQWDFGDGAGASGVQVSHVYGRAGTYSVTLTVRDDAGRTATVTREVEVAAPES